MSDGIGMKDFSGSKSLESCCGLGLQICSVVSKIESFNYVEIAPSSADNVDIYFLYELLENSCKCYDQPNDVDDRVDLLWSGDAARC